MSFRVLALSVVLIMCCGLCSGVKAMLYTYLKNDESFCVSYDHVLRGYTSGSGSSNDYTMHYSFKGEEESLDGTVYFTSNQAKGLFLGGFSRGEALDPRVGSINFPIDPKEGSKFCFTYSGSRTKVPFEFEVGAANVNPLHGADEDQVEQYMDMVQGLENVVATVRDEVEYLSSRQDDFEGTVKSTYIRVIVFTTISVCVVLVSAGLQIWSLKSFFKAKKIV